uniref:Uncharacterized protein n=1 Tax=Anopheles albimanus TaxID=7167 RepID=A0A182FWL1_ANOAL
VVAPVSCSVYFSPYSKKCIVRGLTLCVARRPDRRLSNFCVLQLQLIERAHTHVDGSQRRPILGWWSRLARHAGNAENRAPGPAPRWHDCESLTGTV